MVQQLRLEDKENHFWCVQEWALKYFFQNFLQYNHIEEQ